MICLSVMSYPVDCNLCDSEIGGGSAGKQGVCNGNAVVIAEMKTYVVSTKKERATYRVKQKCHGLGLGWGEVPICVSISIEMAPEHGPRADLGALYYFYSAFYDKVG